MSSQFEQSAIVVTGAGRGIGRAVAVHLARTFHRPMWLISRSEKPLEETVARCREEGSSLVRSTVCDLSSTDQLSGMDRPADLPPIGMMIHNAGSFLLRTAEATDESELTRQWILHARAPIELTRRFLPELRSLDRGLLVYIGSDVVLRGKPGHAAYASSKQALHGWVSALRRELEETRIAATLIHPGQVLTHSWEGVNVEPDELASAEDLARLLAILPTLSPRTVVSEIYLGPQRGERSPD
ncbi:MAG: SDR family NAD(P)-dependent oxidoreductase [Bacteroidota bacterium]